MKRIILLTIGIFLATTACSYAVTMLEWTSGTYEITDGDNYSSSWIHLRNSTTVNMIGGTVGTLFAYDSSTFTMSGGRYSGYGIVMDNASHAEISGGDVTIFMRASSTADITGGNIYWASLSENSIINLSGSDVAIRLFASGGSIANIYGTGFQYSPTGGAFSDGFLTGYWANGNQFTINLDNDGDTTNTYAHINLHVIPEPVIFSFLVFGSLAIVVRRKKTSS